MAWKQDLAKLKQQLGPETPAPPPAARPKAAPKPEAPPVLEDEDAVFLSAMGLKSAPPRPRKAEAPSAPGSTPAPAPEPAAPETFAEAVKELKGLKPLPGGIPAKATPVPTPAAKPIVQAPLPPPEPAPPAAAPELPPEPARATGTPALPVRFQLAAGMAIEVDGALDLRGHTLSDAMERLKDRLGDGTVLGWRSLQVTLGSDPVLHEGLLDLLNSGQAPGIARYAQAPVPMGGTQAWLLYFGPLPAHS